MKRYLLFTTSILCIHMAKAQHFEWAVSVGGAETKMLSSAIDAQGNTLLLIDWEYRLDNRNSGDFYINDGFGRAINCDEGGDEMLMVVKLDRDGRVLWQRGIKSFDYAYSSLPEEAFITCHQNGDISIFYNSQEGLYVTGNEYWDMLEEKYQPVFDRYDEKENSGEDNSDAEDEENDDQEEESDTYNDEEEGMNKRSGLFEIVLAADGSQKNTAQIYYNNDVEVKGAAAVANGGNVLVAFLSADSVTMGKTTIDKVTGGALLVIKTDSMGTVEWVKPTRFLDKSCCTIYDSRIAVSPNGNIYITSMGEEGVEYPDGKKEKFTTSTGKNVVPDESFILALDARGNVLWHKTSGSNATVNAITATDKEVFISGGLILKNSAYGLKADTAGGKRGYLAKLDARTGKPVWIKTSEIKSFVALTPDNAGNIYGIGEYQYRYDNQPAWFYTDTLPYRSSDFIVAGFDNNGKYRWMKPAPFIMHDFSEYTCLLHDDCSNLYLAGSVFAGMELSSQYMDGAYLREQYGRMGYFIKIKNNMAPLMRMNVAVDDKSKPQNPILAWHTSGYTGKLHCAISPGPWKVFYHPQFFSGIATITANTTYADEAVSLEIYNTETRTLAATLLSNKRLAKGTHEFHLNAAALGIKPGCYLILLRGTAAIATERLIYR